MWKDIHHLIFPNLCPACENPLPGRETTLCVQCFETLPKTSFHLTEENPAHKLFYGRFSFDKVTSALFFSKGGGVQRILHAIKYRGQTELAENLGEWYGSVLGSLNILNTNPVFVPVPLHEKKQYQRGYNQAYHLAKGLAKGYMNSSTENLLVRVNATETQTKKGRFGRWINVDGVFQASDRFNLPDRKFVLVDDVLTTGSTLESCALVLKKNGVGSVSAVTLAFAGPD